jgi:orotidine-5'-phosphate decarboxylase
MRPEPGAAVPMSPSASAAVPYADLLGARLQKTGTSLCLGVDPDPAALPAGFPADVRGVESFAGLLLDAALEQASAVKVNLAFFEAFGSAGLAALERLRARIPADVPFIADAKRGDIGSTTERHALALYDVLGAHAVTASPYLGEDALEPLLARPERAVYVLCRTTNPGAAELQGLLLAADPSGPAPAEALFVHVARRVADWAARAPAAVGLVVGATAPQDLLAVRAVAPAVPFLVPGVGAQGGDETAVLASGRVREGPFAGLRGGGLLLNVSRGIAAAAMDGPDPALAMATAARAWAERLRCYDGPSPHRAHEGH